MTKTRWESDVVNLISLVYAETKIELSGPILPSTICDENQTRPRHDQLFRRGQRRKQY